ncbi:hypothetical protein [Microbacterium sp. 10M-3C3]|jgi:hypothetical protein|uniref:hypothetical protein n=1 Tax=Microbacterium sp. 10M-3C3 TaxID=2483401 RepID=UPI000F63BFC9|nr:hypothetical protein [Microbacterium sp. 10M-3C3]
MTRVRRLVAATVLAGTLVLGSCAAQPANDGLSSLVVSAADQVAAGDATAASASLDALEARVEADREAGSLSAGQADAILATIATIRADLAAQASPSPAPAPTQADDDAEDSGSEDSEPDNSGPGGDKDKPKPPNDDKGSGKNKP